MRCLVVIALLAFAGFVSAAVEDIPANHAKKIDEAMPDKPAVEPKKPRRVLIWVTPAHLMEKDPHKGYCIPYGTYALKAMGHKTKAYEPVVSQDLAMFLPQNIRQFDAIMMNNSSGPWITPTEADLQREEFKQAGKDAAEVEAVLRKSLLDYVEGGGGLTGLHYAIGANRHWPDFERLMGARYGGHPWHEEVGVKLDDPGHPINAAFDGKDFRLTEEIYQFANPYNRAQLRVLFSLDTTKTNMNVKWIDRKDGDFALAWVKSVGKGRLFYTAVGHRTEVYSNTAILKHYLRGIQFTTGDLDAPTKPLEQAAPPAADDEKDFTSLFNGKDLTGWEGDTKIWSVRDGAITGVTTAQTGLKVNDFLIWAGGKPRNFELRLQYKLVGGNSGIYFHAEKQEEGEPLIGPQADFSADHRWTGVLMEWKKRDILAQRGQKVTIDADGRKTVIATLGDPKELLKAVKDEDWNDYRVVVRDGHVLLAINGTAMCEVIDKDPRRAQSGHLALQVHTGPPMTVQFRKIRIRMLE